MYANLLIVSKLCKDGKKSGSQRALEAGALLGGKMPKKIYLRGHSAQYSNVYRSGWAAHEIYSALSLEDFLCGKSMFPIAAINGSAQINADVFGHWVSTVYITLAQVDL